MKKRLLVGAIVFIWLAIPAFKITMECVAADIVDGRCLPNGVHSSKTMEKVEHVIRFFVAYLLPLSVMAFCYIRIAHVLRTKVAIVPTQSATMIYLIVSFNHLMTFDSILSIVCLYNIFTSPPVGEAKYCDDRVCLSVREHISETARLIFTKFCTHVTLVHGSVLF